MSDRQFKCLDCGKKFMEYASPRKDSNDVPICPHCGKTPPKVERIA